MATEATAAQPVAHPSLWRNRDYMLLWSGQFVSILGGGISAITYPLLVLRLTHSPAQAGILEAVASLPFLLFSLPAGALVDRWNRKRLMILCDALNAVLMAGIGVAYALGRLTIAQLYISALIGGICFLFFNLSETSSLPRVVPREQLPSASAQNEASGSAANLIAPPLGGFLYQTIGAAVPFIADAISYAASVISLSFIRTEFQGERTVQHRKLRTEIAEGVRWLWSHPLIRYMAFLVGGCNFGNEATGLLLIVLAQRQGASPALIGVMFAIAGVGGLFGAMVAPRFQRRFTFGQVIITTMFVTALLWPLFAIAPNAIVLGIIFAGFFAVIPIFNAVQFSYRLALIPDALQGRVNSSFRMLAYGFQPIGAALGGILIQAIGPKPTVVFFSLVTLGLALATAANSHVRHARPITEIQAVATG
jgi:predicted MFS family arabinose efflux permease